MNENTGSAFDPNEDDLPLMANAGCMLVRHYVIDLAVNFDKKVINSTIVLFLEANQAYKKASDSVGTGCCPYSRALFETEQPGLSCDPTARAAACSSVDKICNLSEYSGDRVANVNSCNHSNKEWASGISGTREHCSDGEDFVLVLDCCDLLVHKVEEVNVIASAGIEKLMRMDMPKPENGTYSQRLQNDVQRSIVDDILGLAAECWQKQHYYYLQCSQAPGCGELQFQTDMWSLKIKKLGIQTPKDFPRVLRICYETKSEGGSVRWTKDQSGRPCVYTAGSPINNRALFPCQEPPEAMATWQASVWAPKGSLVLMSGENSAEPTHNGALSNWFYYVTMLMPASTFTIAVGYWVEVQPECTFISEILGPSSSFSTSITKSSTSLPSCGHSAYPCRLHNPVAQAQDCIPYRVFAPDCLKLRSQEVLFPLVARCLSAAHCVLGTHPFSRVDVLIVSASFPSLGMASPHIIFLSQSVLSGKNHLCGVRLCHEIAHAWFGLAIGARDWTEEWISEGFATYLEDVFWENAQKLSEEAAKEQQQLKSLLRWRRLQDELQNSEEELQVLRPNKQSTGEVSDSGATNVKHGLNPGKIFMQVHYLKGYFLLHYLENRVGQKPFLKFFRLFVERFHGQLILSQDFLYMFMEHFSELKSPGLSMEAIYQNWLDVAGIPKPLLDGTLKWTENRLVREVQDEVVKWVEFNKKNRKRTRTCKRKRSCKDVVTFKELLPDQLVLLLELLFAVKSLSSRTLQWLQKHYCLREQDAEVRHRWCELVIKHKHTVAYGDLIIFLEQDQAMGVYLYGELMVNEDAKQQQLVHRCFTKLQEEMDPSLQKVVAEMIL